MVADCLPSSPRELRSTSPSRISVNLFSRSADRMTPATIATTTRVISTATTPCGSTVSFMKSWALLGTNWENRNHTTSAVAKNNGIQ